MLIPQKILGTGFCGEVEIRGIESGVLHFRFMCIMLCFHFHLLVTFTLSCLSVGTLLHLDQLRLDLVQLSTKLQIFLRKQNVGLYLPEPAGPVGSERPFHLDIIQFPLQTSNVRQMLIQALLHVFGLLSLLHVLVLVLLL